MGQKLTEYWNNNIYQMDFQHFFHDAIEAIRTARDDYSLQNMIRAHASVEAFRNCFISNENNIKIIEKEINPSLEKIDCLLNDKRGSHDYNKAKDEIKAYRKIEKRNEIVVNARNIIKELNSVMEGLKIIGFSQNMFLIKANTKPLGAERLDDVAQM